MLEYVIRGATIIDGTGAPGVVGDIGIDQGRIVAVGTVTDDGCTKTHTRALDCEQILSDGTHMPLAKQTDPCGGDPNFTN